MVNFLTAPAVQLLNQHVWLRVTPRKNSMPLSLSPSAGACCFCNYSCKDRWWSNHFIRNLTLDSSRENWLKCFLSHTEIIARICTLLPDSIPSSSLWGNSIFLSPYPHYCSPPSRGQAGNKVNLESFKISVRLSFSLSTAACFSRQSKDAMLPGIIAVQAANLLML